MAELPGFDASPMLKPAAPARSIDPGQDVRNFDRSRKIRAAPARKEPASCAGDVPAGANRSVGIAAALLERFS